MKRAIFTLVALGVLLPLAAETARAQGRGDRGRRDEARGRSEKHEDKGLAIRADRGGLTIGYRSTTRRGHRGSAVRVDLRLGHRPPPRQIWVAGHYEIQERHVRQPDRIERFWVTDRYEVRRDACGRPYRVLVEEAHWVERVIPGEVIVERVRVWIPGHFERC